MRKNEGISPYISISISFFLQRNLRLFTFLHGQGSYIVSGCDRLERTDRTDRNPQTGEEMTLPASKVPAFKPGKELKEAVK